MKRALCLGVVLGGSLAVGHVMGQSYGPGQQGAVLKSPFMESKPAAPQAAQPTMQPPASPQGAYVQGMWGGAAPPANAGPSTPFLNMKAAPPDSQYAALQLSLPNDGPDPNQDILVTTKEGPWMISVASYMGEKAPEMARAMATELRGRGIPAFVFSRGREERKKEYERVAALLEKQRTFYRDNKLPVPSNLRVRYRNVQEQCAVVMGNYGTLEAARRDLERVKRFDPPNPERVPLDKQWYVKTDPKTGRPKTDPKTGQPAGEHVYVNPFKQAFVVHNPVLKQEDGVDPSVDIELLRQLNRGVPYSLLECKKPYTLVVKQFFMRSTIQTVGSKGGSFMHSLGLGGNENGEQEDVAAQNAQSLASVFRKQANLDSFVLHTRNSSIVTVGAFDSLQDPRLESTRNLLTTQLGVPQALPMAVPR